MRLALSASQWQLYSTVLCVRADLLYSRRVQLRNGLLPLCSCWAVQVGLLTPLTFAQHHLSPLAAFTSGAYFLHNGRR